MEWHVGPCGHASSIALPVDSVAGIDASSLNLLSALGLSGAAGLNPWLPPFLVATFARAGWIDLDPSWSVITHTPVIAVLGLLFLLDFVADKIPALDHALHVVGLAVHPVVGAGLFDLSGSGHLPTILALLAGGTVAGSVHATRATARPAVNGLTGGLGTPIVSIAEDFASLLLAIGALLFPIASALAVLILLAGTVLLARRVWRWRRARAT